MNQADVTWWKDKKVLVTGHSGFKGSWMCMWLNRLEARVFGLSLKPKFKEDLFLAANVESLCERSIFGNITEHQLLIDLVKDFQPDVVFHMAAQALVRESYKNPIETFNTNIIGTVNLLDALRNIDKNVAVVVVTTDKVYRNKSLGAAFAENDTLGGDDPYSASKAAAELAVDSYRASYFEGLNIRVAAARAGNVIGGGDWSNDRLIPDLFRALRNKNYLVLRNPTFTRPWQHVLDPLRGYLVLAKSISEKPGLQGAYNFGPAANVGTSVQDVVQQIQAKVPSLLVREEVSDLAPKEAELLSLDTTLARQVLGVSCKWDLEQTISHTINWYVNYLDGADPYKLCLDDLDRFEIS